MIVDDHALALYPILLFGLSRADLSDRLAAFAVHDLRHQHRIGHHRGYSFHARSGHRQPAWGVGVQMSTYSDSSRLRRGGTRHRDLRLLLASHLPLRRRSDRATATLHDGVAHLS